MKKLFLSVLILMMSGPAFAAETESAYERVIRTGTIHCGYGVWAPNIIEDVNSGKLSGIFYDYMNAVGKATNLKVEWREVAWTDFVLELKSGRIDAMCAGIWPTGARAREMDFTTPINYVGINAYARADDKRFDNALQKINAAAITIPIMDMEMSSIIAAADYPAAKTFSISSAGSPQMLLNVATGKADVTFSDTSTATDFIASNPGKIRMIAGGESVRVFGNTVAIGKGQAELKSLIDITTQELMQSGVIEKILLTYETRSGNFIRVAKPYEVQK